MAWSFTIFEIWYCERTITINIIHHRLWLNLERRSNHGGILNEGASSAEIDAVRSGRWKIIDKFDEEKQIVTETRLKTWSLVSSLTVDIRCMGKTSRSRYINFRDGGDIFITDLPWREHRQEFIGKFMLRVNGCDKSILCSQLFVLSKNAAEYYVKHRFIWTTNSSRIFTCLATRRTSTLCC